MAQKIYVVEGRKFRTEADYQNALKDQQVIENLRVQTKKMSLADQKKLPLNCVMISCPCATRLRNQLFDKSHK